AGRNRIVGSSTRSQTGSRGPASPVGESSGPVRRERGPGDRDRFEEEAGAGSAAGGSELGSMRRRSTEGEGSHLPPGSRTGGGGSVARGPAHGTVVEKQQLRAA